MIKKIVLIIVALCVFVVCFAVVKMVQKERQAQHEFNLFSLRYLDEGGLEIKCFDRKNLLRTFVGYDGAFEIVTNKNRKNLVKFSTPVVEGKFSGYILTLDIQPEKVREYWMNKTILVTDKLWSQPRLI